MNIEAKKDAFISSIQEMAAKSAVSSKGVVFKISQFRCLAPGWQLIPGNSPDIYSIYSTGLFKTQED
jgi:hypothetical protein